MNRLNNNLALIETMSNNQYDKYYRYKTYKKKKILYINYKL